MAVPRGTCVMVRRDAEDKTGVALVPEHIPLSGLGKPEIEAGSQAN